MIPQRNLSLISNALAAQGGRRVPESVIERDYVLAWFLTGLARHPLREVLAFKGGTALRRCWFADYRFSEDLDFTLVRPLSFEEIRAGLDEVFEDVQQETGIEMAFDRLDSRGHKNSHTFYLRYQGPLPAPNTVKVDITIRESLGFALCARPILRTYPEFNDLGQNPAGEEITGEEATVLVYAVEEIAVEKIVALSDRARTEPRDLFDLWHLLEETDVQIPELKAEIEAKLAFRERTSWGLTEAIAAKDGRLKALWSERLAHQMTALPPYEGVFREVMRAVRDADFPAAPLQAEGKSGRVSKKERR